MLFIISSFLVTSIFELLSDGVFPWVTPFVGLTIDHIYFAPSQVLTLCSLQFYLHSSRARFFLIAEVLFILVVVYVP